LFAPVSGASKRGNYYEVTSGPVTIPGNNFLGIELSNPGSSDMEIYIARIIDAAVPSTTFTLYRNGTFEGGTPLIPFNGNFGSSNQPAAEVKIIVRSADPFAGAIPFSTTILTGESLPMDFNGRIILPPGTSLGIRAANNTPQPNLAAVTVGWWEERP
jgi:hypothetical protein